MIEIKVIRNDNIDAFGAYAKKKNLILFNVQANLITALEEKIDFKDMILTTIMHEFGHCLEEKLNLEFSDERINKIVESYINKYRHNG